MEPLRFHIVDVFAEEKYAGNQLAVIEEAAGLSSDTMQKIAKEMGFSETTFILSDTPREGGYDVRIFTPAAEVPFAGHPTLGTASVIRRKILRKSVDGDGRRSTADAESPCPGGSGKGSCEFKEPSASSEDSSCRCHPESNRDRPRRDATAASPTRSLSLNTGCPPTDCVILNLKVGPIPVVFEPQASGDELPWMTPNEATFHDVFDAREVAPLLRLRPEDIDIAFPIETVSTGLPFVFVPLRSLDAVRRACVRRDEWLAWVEGRLAKMVCVFCRETVEPDNQIHARMFADYYGIVEDPATGSANSCLAAYLVKHRYFDADRIDVRVEQGYEIGRPSRIYLRAHDDGQRIRVQVGGRVFAIAEGSLL